MLCISGLEMWLLFGMQTGYFVRKIVLFLGFGLEAYFQRIRLLLFLLFKYFPKKRS